MSFTIGYRSIQTMHPAGAFAIRDRCAELSQPYTWISCEPVFVEQEPDGYLVGFSKPSFLGSDADVRLVETGGLPDGTVETLIDVLCAVSREMEVDWEISHDFEPEPIGRIVNGEAESILRDQIESLASVNHLLEVMMAADEEDDDFDEAIEEAFDEAIEEAFDDVELETQQDEGSRGTDAQGRDDDDDFPRVIKFPGR